MPVDRDPRLSRSPVHVVIALVVRFVLAPGREAAFDALVAETCLGIAAHEPGTLAYAVTRDSARPPVRTFLEVYRDEAAFRSHEEQPHTRRFVERRGDHLAAPITVERLTVTELAVHVADVPVGS
jgi:quinol monooxygenase YgiN